MYLENRLIKIEDQLNVRVNVRLWHDESRKLSNSLYYQQKKNEFK